MATDQRNLPSYFNTDTDFRNYCAGIHAQLAACGLVNTTDTGQINNATVTKPGGALTSQGYEIWKFNDTLQAAVPIFIKIEYGSSNAATNPAIWITVGTSTNGSGTLSVTSTRTIFAGNITTSASSVNPSYCSGDGSRIALVNNYNSGNGGSMGGFVLDRLRDGFANSTSEGFCLVGLGTQAGGAQSYAQTWNYTNAWSAQFAGTLLFSSLRVASTHFSGQGTTTVGNNVALCPPIVISGQLRYLLAMAFYNSTDLAANTTITVNNLGNVHTYMTLPSSPPGPSFDSNAFLWE